MSDSGEDRFAKFRARAQKNRAIEEAERRERPKVASSKIMVGGEDVLADEEISVSLWEAVNRLAYEDQVWFSLTKSVDPDTVITRDFCVGRMLDPIGLVGSTFRQIRTAVNRTVGSFRADCGGGDTQEMRCGGYRRADDGTLEKSPLYGKNHVKVSVTEAVVARVLASFCENSTVTSLVNDADKGKSGAKIETHIAKSNSDLNLSTKDGALLALCQNLVVQDPTGKDLFYWKRIEKWIASQELTSTGLDILYWCYRRADLDLSDLPTEEPLPVEEFFKTWTQFPLVRSQMNGLFRQAVWKDGSPVPTHLSLSSMIKLFGPKAIVGRIPSKLASCLTNIILKTDTVSAIESSSGVSVEFVGSSDYSKTDADCFWNPSGIEAAAFKGTLIAVPISTHSQVKLAVDKFARSEKKYALAVTYGSSPTLWCQENVDGYARKQLGVALDLLVASAHWMPFYNLSNAIAGAIDIWGIRMVPTGLDVLRVDTLNCYCYVSMQVKSKIPFYSDDFGAAELVLPTVRDDSLSTRIMRDAAADDAPLVPVARVLGHKRSKVSKPGDDFATQAPEGGFEFFPPTEGPGVDRMYG